MFLCLSAKSLTRLCQRTDLVDIERVRCDIVDMIVMDEGRRDLVWRGCIIYMSTNVTVPYKIMKRSCNMAPFRLYLCDSLRHVLCYQVEISHICLLLQQQRRSLRCTYIQKQPQTLIPTIASHVLWFRVGHLGDMFIYSTSLRRCL